MTCSVEYDLATGRQLSSCSPATPETQPVPEGKGRMYFEDRIDTHGMMVDIAQNPPVLVAAPPDPPPLPDMLTLIFNAMIKQGWIDPAEVQPDLLASVNASLATIGIKGAAPATVA